MTSPLQISVTAALALLCLGTCALSASAETPPAGLATVSASKALIIEQPLSAFEHIAMKAMGHFRVVFRVQATSDDVHAVVFGVRGVHRLMVADGWQAVVSSGASCAVAQQFVKGIPVYSSSTYGTAEDVQKWAQSPNAGTSGIVLSSSSPTLLIGDFDCDSPISAGDTATVQVRLYVGNKTSWHAADYTIEKIDILSR